VHSMGTKAVEASGFVSSNHRLDVDAYAFRQCKYDISTIPGGLLRFAAKSLFFGVARKLHYCMCLDRPNSLWPQNAATSKWSPSRSCCGAGAANLAVLVGKALVVKYGRRRDP
jgi:hypothetical protein